MSESTFATPAGMAPPTVEMHGKTVCGYCDDAKAWFAQHQVPYILVLHDDPDEWLAWKAKNRATGAPWIFLDGQPIGGFDRLLASGLEHFFR